MNTKQFVFSLILPALLPIVCVAQETKTHKLDLREHSQRLGCKRIIPTHIKAQYAGGIGIASVGFGWDYGKKCRWETDIMVGYVPKYNSESGHVTVTLKQNYIPWSIYPTSKFSIEPICFGAYLSTISGKEFWLKQPDFYPDNYYWFSTKLRLHALIGTSITLHPSTNLVKGVRVFFEANTCELYVVRSIGNKYLRPSDIVTLSCGIKLQLL